MKNFLKSEKPPAITEETLAQLGDYVPGSKIEKSLVRSVDLRLFPAVWLMYFCNYLDRTNIGNARIQGLAADLDLNDSRYSTALLIFFVSYLLFEPPSQMLMSIVRPSQYLPMLTLVWGIMGGLMSTVQSYQGLVVIRFFLGVVEAGFFVGVWYLISSWYRQNELGKRMAFFYAAAILSGAFGGLLAGALIESMEGLHGIRGWRWLFIIEGIMTVACALYAFFVLPDWPQSTSWLTPEQRHIAVLRLAADKIGVSRSANKKELGHWQSLKAAFRDWRTLYFVILYMLIVGSGTISYFIPSLTRSLGYQGKSAQYMTIPIYVVATVLSVGTSLSSDYFGERPIHIIVPSTIAGITFIIQIFVTNNTARYVLLVFGASGIWSALPQILAWYANIVSYPSEKKALGQAIINGMGNTASIYGSYLWTGGPRYRLGNGTTAAFCLGAAAWTALGYVLHKKYPYDFDPTPYVGRDPEKELQEETHSDIAKPDVVKA